MTTRYRLTMVSISGDPNCLEANGMYAEQLIYGKYEDLRKAQKCSYLALFESKDETPGTLKWNLVKQEMFHH